MYSVLPEKTSKPKKMNKNFTFLPKCITLIIIAIVLIATISYAQSSPKLSFASPELVSGTDGQKEATYKFSNVVAGVDAFVKIEDIKGGAVLINIDDASLGYYDAWQPTVSGPGTVGTSYINWSIKFKTTSGADYNFPIMDLTAVDIDGDNSMLREFIDVKGQSSYDAPTMIPTLLTISNANDDGNGDDHGDGDDYGNHNGEGNNNFDNVHVLGPIANRLNIDTSSLDVKMNFHFTNQSEIEITTGAQVDDNGSTAGVAPSRYNSLYFKSTSNTINILPVTYRTFYATLNNSAVNLFWTTDAEVSNNHFEVERSFDQLTFSTAGIVMGAQDINGASGKYTFKDASTQLANHTVVYYRLKQVDADGKFTYSSVKMVRLSEVSKVSVQVSPNPYMDKLNINFVNDASGNAEVRLISASGTLVKIASTSITKGYNSIQIQNLNSEPSGLYIANITINGREVASLKVIKQ
jgi:hypothetical protein